jgi:hypothetical protein
MAVRRPCPPCALLTCSVLLSARPSYAWWLCGTLLHGSVLLLSRPSYACAWWQCGAQRAMREWLELPQVKAALHVKDIPWADHDGWDRYTCTQTGQAVNQRLISFNVMKIR